ncbi:tripartite motif-containing protein 16-like [Hoplias malabaricus]|uniref:tripartite motif-containing protein 16-like n=1 Tax=Hoplias malabaricus TaxID=27720 RepID=UPI0034622B13
MAEASVLLDQDQLVCSVCLDFLKEPVTIPCGHSFCMVCINDCWDQEDQTGVYSCPQCRETLTLRPVLRRNNFIAEILEKLKKTPLQMTPPAGPGDVKCDFCTGRKLKAVQSCLVCLVSLCEAHLKPHREVPALRKHKLVKASSQLQENVCSQHDKLMEIYCRTDHSCICYLCTMHEHKGHDTVAAVAERTHRQSEALVRFQKFLQAKEEKLLELKNGVETLKSCAQTAVEDSGRMFTELTESIGRRCSEVKELIRAQEKTELIQTEELIQQLETEISDLKRRRAELEQLSHSEDHIQFLQGSQSLCDFPENEESSKTMLRQNLSFNKVNKTLCDLKERVEQICSEEFSKIPPQTAAVRLILPSIPKTREDFLQYWCELSLDPNTNHSCLTLSDNNRVVQMGYNQNRYSYPDSPERFYSYYQVLCVESVSGRCYWEVECTGWVSVSVSYKDIGRKSSGHECKFGYNDQSWSLWCLSPFSFWHKSIQVTLQAQPCSRIGVYVDHGGGTLSFYSVSDTMTPIHTIHTTFTQPLYAGFELNANSSAKLCDP